MMKTTKKNKEKKTISKKTLKSMDVSMKNIEKGNVYGPINLK